LWETQAGVEGWGSWEQKTKQQQVDQRTKLKADRRSCCWQEDQADEELGAENRKPRVLLLLQTSVIHAIQNEVHGQELAQGSGLQLEAGLLLLLSAFFCEFVKKKKKKKKKKKDEPAQQSHRTRHD
jgi:hypothetical protein